MAFIVLPRSIWMQHVDQSHLSRVFDHFDKLYPGEPPIMKFLTRRRIASAFCPIPLLAAVCLILAADCRGERARSADAFVDSIGLNIHLHDGDTPYGNFPAVENSLKTLGVRHVRDGLIDTKWLPYYDRMNTLGRDGIKCIFITNPQQTTELLQSYPERMQDSFEGYEAPNEYDNRHGSDWAATLNRFLPVLANAVRTNRRDSGFTIIGPSFIHAESYAAVSRSSQYFDYSNLHNYFAGRNPGTPGWGANGYGALAWDLAQVGKVWPRLPIVTTETGYLNDLNDPQGIPETVAGKYLPRLLLEQYAHGIRRTYIYELLDVVNASNTIHSRFGLVHPDFSPKPGYSAIQHLISILADPGPSFTPHDLAFTLSGQLSNVHHLLFQKRDGTYLLTMWQEVPSYDVNAKKPLPVTSQQVICTFSNPFVTEELRLKDDGSLTKQILGSTSRIVVPTDDHVVVFKLSLSSRPSRLGL